MAMPMRLEWQVHATAATSIAVASIAAVGIAVATAVTSAAGAVAEVGFAAVSDAASAAPVAKEAVVGRMEAETLAVAAWQSLKPVESTTSAIAG